MYMRLVCGCVMAGVILITARPSAVQAQKKDQDNGGKTTQGTPAEYAALLQMREVVGKLSNTSGKSLSFDIEYLVPGGGGGNNGINFNPGGGQNYQQQMARLLQQQRQARKGQNPQQQLRQLAQQMQKMQMQQMYGGQKGGGNVNRAYKEFEVDLTDNVVVRRNFVPFEYDDKGYAKTYTQAELAAMRGKDVSKPGYTAKFEDLQGGQIVKLYLSNPNKGEAKADPKKKNDKKADDDGVGNVTKPVVTMILILADAPGGAATPNNPPRKKN